MGADAYLLSGILHDWDDDHAREILAGWRRAAAPDGTVVVIEPVRGQGADTAIDLFMLMCFGGRERTVDELAGLAADCGLMLHSWGPVAEDRAADHRVPCGTCRSRPAVAAVREYLINYARRQVWS